ncbi:hypothetical protein C1646_663537, partial [Rhizophagus diaphanus]
HQQFFPFIRKFHEINFDYKEKLFDDLRKLLWKAETQGENRFTIVIKFTHSYNRKAHELCHSIGKVSRLLCISLAHMMRMIIMKYVDGQKLCDCCDLKGSEYKRIIKEIEEAVDLLHENDFNWAGEDNKDLYLTFMNADINWPTGVEDNKILKKEHDIHWLDVLKRKYLNEIKEMPTTEVEEILATELYSIICMHDHLVKLVENAMHEMYHLPNFPDQLRQEISKMKTQPSMVIGSNLTESKKYVTRTIK